MSSLEMKLQEWLKNDEDQELNLDFNMQQKPYDYYCYTDAQRKNFEALLKDFLFIHHNKLGRNKENEFILFEKANLILARCQDILCKNRRLRVECGEKCNIGKFCQNKRFQNRIYKKTLVSNTEDKKYRLIVEEVCEEGQFVMEYVGKVILNSEYNTLTRRYIDKGLVPRFLAMSSEVGIDATIMGNLSRFLNHSCDPNCYLQVWLVNGEMRLGIFALRRIKNGEELTIKYNFANKSEQGICLCKSINCKGNVILDNLSVNTDRFQKIVDIYSEFISTEEQSLYLISQLWFNITDLSLVELFFEKLKVIKDLQIVFRENHGMYILYNLYKKNTSNDSFIEKFIKMLLELDIKTVNEIYESGIIDCMVFIGKKSYSNKKLARQVLLKWKPLQSKTNKSPNNNDNPKFNINGVNLPGKENNQPDIEEYNPATYTCSMFNVKTGSNKKLKDSNSPGVIPDAYFEDLVPKAIFMDQEVRMPPKNQFSKSVPLMKEPRLSNSNYAPSCSNDLIGDDDDDYQNNDTFTINPNLNYDNFMLPSYNENNGNNMTTLFNSRREPSPSILRPYNNEITDNSNRLQFNRKPSTSMISPIIQNNSNPTHQINESNLVKFQRTSSTHNSTNNGCHFKERFEGGTFHFRDPNVSHTGDPSKTTLELELTRLFSIEIAIQLFPKAHIFTREAFDRYTRKLVTSLVDKEMRKQEFEHIWTNPTDFIKKRRDKIYAFLQSYFSQTSYAHHFS